MTPTWTHNGPNGDSKPIKYASLLFKSLSIESIVWQLKSIKNDRMKPTEKLMLSRIKEYFALKINLKDWSSFIDKLRLFPDEVNKHDGIQPKISIAASLEDNNLDNSQLNKQEKQKMERNKVLNIILALACTSVVVAIAAYVIRQSKSGPKPDRKRGTQSGHL